jgi:hypothetical protein
MDNQLFEIEPEPIKKHNGLTCQSCRHIYHHEYGNMKYCALQRQRGTAYGDKKIKSRDPACPKYEPK